MVYNFAAHAERVSERAFNHLLHNGGKIPATRRDKIVHMIGHCRHIMKMAQKNQRTLNIVEG